MAFKAARAVITLEGEDIVRLQEILMDEVAPEALVFLRDVIGEKVRCAQAESHRPEFEGGTGREGVHYLQKDERHAGSA